MRPSPHTLPPFSTHTHARALPLQIYRLNRRLPPIQAGVPRTYVITDNVAKVLPAALVREHVLASSSSAKLSVNVGGGEAAMARASVSLMFGRTEVTAMAHSITTGDRKKVSINWDANSSSSSSSGGGGSGALPPTVLRAT